MNVHNHSTCAWDCAGNNYLYVQLEFSARNNKAQSNSFHCVRTTIDVTFIRITKLLHNAKCVQRFTLYIPEKSHKTNCYCDFFLNSVLQQNQIWFVIYKDAEGTERSFIELPIPPVKNGNYLCNSVNNYLQLPDHDVFQPPPPPKGFHQPES